MTTVYKKERRDPQIQSYETAGGKRWRVKFSITIKNKKYHVEKQGFKTFDAARSGKRENIDKLENQSSWKNVTVEEYFDKYVEEKLNNGSWRYLSYKQIKHSFEKMFYPTWGKIKLSDVTRLEYQLWITKFASENNYYKSTMRNLNTTISSIFADALLNDVIQKNPIQKIKISGAGPRDTSMTRLEFTTVFNFIKESPLLTLQQRTMASLTIIGLRHEEITGVKLKYVKDNMVGVFETINIHGELSIPKTNSSKRWVPMTPIIEELVNECITANRLVYASNNIIMSKDSFIFVNHLARHVRYSELSEIFKIISAGTGIKVWPHKMRHAFSTIAFGIAGINPRDIANILGHSKVDMSLYYNNGTDEGKQDTMSKVIDMI